MENPQQPAAPVQPAAPAAPAAPAQPAAPAAPAADPLDDLFPSNTPAAPVQPAAPAAPAAPAQPAAAPTTPDDAAKLKAEFDQRFQQSTQQLNQTVNQSVEQMNAKLERTTELNNFFSNADNEPFRKFQNEITKVATDPRFIGLKLNRVIGMTLGPETMLKLGAEMAATAGQQANANRTGGNQNPGRFVNNTQMPDYKNMTDQEFTARRDAIMRGERP